MRPSTFEVTIDRMVVVGPKLDEARASRLRRLIEDEIRVRMETIRKPVNPFEGEKVRVDLPGLALETIEWERRVARAAADAVLEAMRGKTQ